MTWVTEFLDLLAGLVRRPVGFARRSFARCLFARSGMGIGGRGRSETRLGGEAGATTAEYALVYSCNHKISETYPAS